MSKQAAREAALIRKIRSLPPEKVAEVEEDFVAFLAQRDDRQLTQAAARLAEKAFRKVWANPADAAYDRL
ncbi:MAG: toxin-antitoxin system, antitoxin component, Xre family protein [Acidobacteria bacterium]|nr:MAG: toxin-antitoxin system, antitoxin component, Xre family protein [Acidobacteriota bacterium]